jgi:hypothetical protein
MQINETLRFTSLPVCSFSISANIKAFKRECSDFSSFVYKTIYQIKLIVLNKCFVAL